MRVGVVFPQTEIGSDPGAVRAYAEAVEGLGYDYLLAYDHVLGADTTNRPNWTRYSIKDSFHEPFVLFGFIAGFTQRIELTTGIIILPQRQTVLVAKQAAEVDVLSGGRLRLGVAVGWNDVEYEALGENFHNRGQRLEEQIAVLRALWTQDSVTFSGRWHTIPGAGINPLPVQRPIPLWFGGGMGDDERVLRRIARLGDGWILNQRPDDVGRHAITRLQQYVKEAGRDPADVGLDGRVGLADGVEEAARSAGIWKEMGASHVGLNTMNAGLRSVNEHIDAIRAFKEALAAVEAGTPGG